MQVDRCRRMQAADGGDEQQHRADGRQVAPPLRDLAVGPKSRRDCSKTLTVPAIPSNLQIIHLTKSILKIV